MRNRFVQYIADFFLKRSVLLGLIAQHMHALGERLNLHTAAIKRLGEHSADLQRQVDLMRQSFELMVEAKHERIKGAWEHNLSDELPN